MNITYEEQTLMSIYNTNGTRAGLIAELREMQGYLSEEEADLAELTDSAVKKLSAMTDAEFEALDLTPDFIPEDSNAE